MSSDCFEVSQQKNLVQKRHDDPNSAPGPGELEECGQTARNRGGHNPVLFMKAGHEEGRRVLA